MDNALIAKRIKDVRDEHKLSQAKFGELLNISQDTVSLWENGKSVPSAEYIVLIATKFQVSADFILGLKEY